MVVYKISKYNTGYLHLKDEDCHRLNDRINYITNNISYELNNKTHRENNQIAYYDKYYKIKRKYLHGELLLDLMKGVKFKFEILF